MANRNVDPRRTGWEPPTPFPEGGIWQVRPRRGNATRTIRKCRSVGGDLELDAWEEPHGPGASEIKAGLYTSDWGFLQENPDLSCPDVWKRLVLPPVPVPIGDLDQLISHLKNAVPGEVQSLVLESGRPAEHGKWPAWAAKLGLTLRHRPYRHQVEALGHIHAGHHVAISTGTASGKSICYMLPIVKATLEHPKTRTLYVAPAKALCDDQLTAWRRLLTGDDQFQGQEAPTFTGSVGGQKITVIRYDADVKDLVKDSKSSAHVILTNPPMLHWMLARWRDWPELFEGLRFVVLDEIHQANGIRGANLAWLMRRLRRIAHHANPESPSPQFVCCSATIANPDQLAGQIIGDGCEVKVVDTDTSEHAQRIHLSWPPPVLKHGSRRGTVVLDLVKALLARPKDGEANKTDAHQTIVFHRSRGEANQTARYQAKQFVHEGRDDLAGTLRIFMAPLTFAARRAILEDLRDGSCLGVFATSALELGIDIGDLSAAIILGIPHGRPSYRQMGGRVGRRSPAIVVYVPRDNPLDNWYADDRRFASHLALAEAEPVITDPENDEVALQHLAAAAKELEINPRTDKTFFGQRLEKRLGRLEEVGDIEERQKGLFYWASADDPFVRINVLAAKGTHTVEIRRVKDRQVIGQVDNWTALWMLFPGAIYEDGIWDTYVVESLHLGPMDQGRRGSQAERVAWVKRATAYQEKHYTVAITQQELDEKKVTGRNVGSLEIQRGPVKVTQSLTDHYFLVRRAEPGSAGVPRQRRKVPVQKWPTAVGPDGERDFRSLTLETEGLWFPIPPTVWEAVVERAQRPPRANIPGEATPQDRALSALHAAEHLICQMTGIVPGIWEGDISGLSIDSHRAFSDGPGIFVHEDTPGGTGLIDVLMEGDNLRNVIRAALERVENCPNKCKNGCPGCVQDWRCGNQNFFLDKEDGRLLLRDLVECVA